MQQKVLIIVENLPVPFDTRVWKQAKALVSQGFKVMVICPKSKKFNEPYQFLEGVHIYRHPMPKEGHGPLGYIREYFWAFFWESFLSLRIFFKHRFNVIQGCNPPDTIFLIALFFKLFNVKYIFDHHDVNPELYEAKFNRKGFLYNFLVLLEQLTFKTCNVSMATNETYRQVAINRGGMDPKKVFVVRNGPDLDTFRFVPPIASLKYGKKYLVGYVGTMSVQEGLDILLQVANYIKEKGRADVHFTCVGGGPGLSELEIMKKKMGLDHMVNFTGRIPDKELLQVLSTADVCVNPDRPNTMNNMSTMIKIMEYMALAKPIVQFDLREGKYSAGDSSLYAESMEDFGEKILWLLDHPEERKRMGEIGMMRVEKNLAWKYSIPSLLAAYNKILE
jgi:glycosyltransferase involved in cell wall biosynthesis